MSSYRIQMTEKAKQELLELSDYIANKLNEKNTAEKYIDVILGAIYSLDEMPMRYKLLENEPHRSRGFRRMLVKSFYIYYSVDVDKSVVTVYSVVYSRRDQSNVI